MYTFTVITITVLLAILAYYLYLKQKGEKLTQIDQGICPECGEKGIEIKRVKGGGCSGTANMIYHCERCGYEEEFNIEAGGSCGSGCRL
ncbi:MAG: hypothetical protein GXO19_07935 [Epsilonproteobacteria bacterium]|nr:hypothetical protein [Campylobacterota bacterium]NPA57640.1 hypothetical protein [Campylobacterota bacterium]